MALSVARGLTMLFLIEYNRREGKVVSKRTFDDSRRHVAQQARLELELRLNREGVEHEVVILEASSEQVLRHTHGRYFKDLSELLKEGIELLDRK